MNTVERLKNILVNDKAQPFKKINTILKSDVYILLLNYFDICESDVACSVDVANGEVAVRINARAKRIKNFIILE
ncbi:MAG: hypothetical protein FWD32_02790 [Firmicutes bacterium]|nr:hypothetical protein [Bacillota bacterium]